MTNPANSAVQNLLPVQAYFDAQNNFVTFIGQGIPFTASISPNQSGLNITSSTINSTTIGATTPSTGVFTNIATTTGTISTGPTANTDIVNKLYVDTVAQGLGPKAACQCGTIANITLSGLQTIDSYTTLAGDRVLVKNQSTSANNGIYIAASGAWTRAVDMDVWAEVPGAYTIVLNGGQAGTGWVCTSSSTGTIGVTAITFVQFSVLNTYYAGTGLTLSSNTFSITPVGTAGTYGSATQTPVFITNASGQVTGVTNTTITPAVGSITGFGTGVATALGANVTGSGGIVLATSPTLITPILGTPTSGNFSTGTFTWPTFNQSTTGTAAGLSATLAIGSGGTGQTTASAAFNALSPITTAGDLIIGNGTNSAIRLAIGTNNQVLTSNGTTASWATSASGMVYPGAGIPNSTGTAWGTSYTTTGSGTVVALATSPLLVTPILGTPQSGNFSTGTFTWPTFNQNTSGTASNVTGTVVVANGGTGVTTLTGLAYGNGTSAFTAATAAQVVAVISTTAVTNATNATNATTATNATNTAITDDTTTATSVYPTWVTTTTGNLPQKTSSTKLSFVPSTGTLTATAFSGLASSATNLAGGAASQIPYQTGSGATTFLANGTTGQVLTSNGASAPTWTTPSSGGSAATPTALGTVYGATGSTTPFLTALGYQAGNANTAVGSIGIGYQALQANTSGTRNVATGYQALSTNITGVGSTAIGYQALKSSTDGSCTAVGASALLGVTTGTGNTAFGFEAAYGISTGVNNVILGNSIVGSTGSFNVAVGVQIGLGAGSYNIAMGYNVLANAAAYSGNIAIGGNGQTGRYIASNNNIAIGNTAMYNSGAGGSCIAIGISAMNSGGATGAYNIGIGESTLTGLTSGATNIAFGYTAGTTLTTGSNNIIIGNAANSSSATVSNETTIGNSSTTAFRIFGTVALQNGGLTELVYAVSGTTPALSPTNGGIQTWTLSGSSTPTAGTWAAGTSMSLQITASTNTVTWTSVAVSWVGGSAPTLSTTGITIIELWKVGSTVYGALVGSV